MSYFSKCESVADVKAEYRKLALRWHPDRPGGNTALMQEINAEYKMALAGKHGEETIDDNGVAHTYYYRENVEQAVMDKIAEVFRSNILSDNVTLWLVGTWLWIEGDTKPHREILGYGNGKGLGFKWNQARQCWQWHLPTKWRPQGSDEKTEEIFSRYGASQFVKGKAELE